MPDVVYSRGLIHRFASVFILDGQNRLLLQKRAHKRRHGGLFSESVSAQVEFNESYLQQRLEEFRKSLGLMNHSDPLLEICKIHGCEEQDEDNHDSHTYLSNDGYGQNKVSNRWKKTAFVTIYKLYLHDDETIKHISINPLKFLTYIC